MIPKKYFYDRMILLLLSNNIAVATVGIVRVLLKLNIGRTGTYIVQYRSSLGKLDGQKSGSVSTFIAFIIFDLLIVIFHMALSIRVYKINRQLAVLVLSIGLILLVFSVVVSYTLLSNH